MEINRGCVFNKSLCGSFIKILSFANAIDTWAHNNTYIGMGKYMKILMKANIFHNTLGLHKNEFLY